MKNLFICLIAFLFIGSISSTGIYLTFRNDGISNIFNQISNDVMNKVNNDKSIPPVSGSNNQVSYTFENWAVDIFLQTPDTTQASNNYAFQWLLFQFQFEWTYHMTAKSWPNPSESGTIYVWTQNWNQKSLLLTSTINIAANPPTYNCDSAQIVANGDDIYIYVDCSDTFCLIPTDDIANSIATSFVPTFQTELQKTMNTEFSKVFEDINLMKKIELEANAALILDLEGAWSLIPDGTKTPGIIVAPTGMVLSDLNNNIVTPPFPDNYTVPSSVLNNPPRELNIYITPYFMETSFWAVNNIGYFNRTLTDAEVPASSPVHLTTNDGFFSSAVPGLTSYPNLNLTVATSIISTPYFFMNTTGLYAFAANLQLDFNIVNQTTIVKNAFGVTISINFNLNSTVTQSGKLFLNSTIINHSETVTITYTNVGQVIGDAFSQLVDLIFSIIKFPGFGIPIPASVSINTPETTYGAGYLQIGMNYVYNVPSSPKKAPLKRPPNVDGKKARHYKLTANSTHIDIKPAPQSPSAVQLCGDGSDSCPSGQTCCKTSSGLTNIKYGCCPFANAVCCGSACDTCCPLGYMCYSDCSCGDGFGKIFQSSQLLF
eukprot:TRINITY_DN3797_c0_g1_i1.p1 TRINITY_DN3797_c0_g1~~TRINITY_DN3797_c0_g1_i1.p1  ORF type:complete len:600 (-),score=170.15 TRINITY_DN3797_c0_g1_i1:36-1835(-)